MQQQPARRPGRRVLATHPEGASRLTPIRVSWTLDASRVPAYPQPSAPLRPGQPPRKRFRRGVMGKTAAWYVKHAKVRRADLSSWVDCSYGRRYREVGELVPLQYPCKWVPPSPFWLLRDSRGSCPSSRRVSPGRSPNTYFRGQ